MPPCEPPRTPPFTPYIPLQARRRGWGRSSRTRPSSTARSRRGRRRTRRAHAHAHMRTCAHAHERSTHAHTLSHTHRHRHTRKHTHTHAHTQERVLGARDILTSFRLMGLISHPCTVPVVERMCPGWPLQELLVFLKMNRLVLYPQYTFIRYIS